MTPIIDLDVTPDRAPDDGSDLDRILLAFVEAVERGERPDRAAYLTKNPEFLAELSDYFAAWDEFRRLAGETEGALFTPGDGPSLPAERVVGRMIGGYRLLAEIGRGGMGTVFRAERRDTGELVALKILPAVAALDARSLARFRLEARAAGLLDHPGIVPVLEVGEADGTHFYAMRLIDGCSLARVLRDWRRPDGPGSDRSPGLARPAAGDPPAGWSEFFRRIAALAAEAADGLDHAHRQGIVHRDVKPANLLLDRDGRVWVTDFGLALLHGGEDLTRTGEVVGTARYMSPEQAAGRAGLVDHRTDVYSLGMTLYELAVGRPAFPGDDRAAVFQRISRDEPPAPRSLEPHIPFGLETVILKATAKAPGDRYPTAGECADDLRRVAAGLPPRARRPGLGELATRWCRRHRPLVVAGAGLAVLALAGFAAVFVYVSAERSRALEALENERLANERERAGRDRTGAALRQAREAVDFFVRVCEDELPDLPPVAPVRRKLLTAALAYYQDILEQHPAGADEAAYLAVSRAKVARLLDAVAAQERLAPLLMIRFPGVRSELRLSRSQSGAIDELLFAADRPSGETAVRRLSAILTPPQTARLRQIVLQHPPPPALLHPELVDALGLTEPQRARLSSVQRDFSRELIPRVLGSPSGNLATVVRDVRAEADRRVKTVLTPDQQQRYRELTGPPIEFDPLFGVPLIPGFPGR